MIFFSLASLGLTEGQSSLVTPHLTPAKSFGYELMHYSSARHTRVVLLHSAG